MKKMQKQYNLTNNKQKTELITQSKKRAKPL
jgi:hypothetical protein